MRTFFQMYKSYKMQRGQRRYSITFRALLPVIGLLALVWFVIRVSAKPSRASYPCQRIAFPLASGFVIWLTGIIVAIPFLHRARGLFARQRVMVGISCFAIAVAILWGAINFSNDKVIQAADPVPNVPIGVAKGIHPGRVVWIHDPMSTDWDGVGDGHLWEDTHTSQKHVDRMVEQSICQLAGEETIQDAWDGLFRYFNEQHGKGAVGYTYGEKITIKVNFTTTNRDNGSVNSQTLEKTRYLDKADTSPQMIVAMLRQLVYEVGVDPCDIAIGDTLCYFTKQWYDICYSEFPDVMYFDIDGRLGRHAIGSSTVRQYWSVVGDSDAYTADYIPDLYADAEYLIDLAVLKGHSAGITLTAKNHYGSYNRRPIASGYYNLHDSLAGINVDEKQYRALVDILGHPEMGGKTLLYMLDGLYGGYYWEGTPYKFNTPPFNNDWPSSVIVSQDPVAIDSVGLDILWEEWPHVVQIGGVDDYLIEAALADNPPSGTFYDPDGDGVVCESLGVHERWNNSTDRQYSRNLGTGDGIELLYDKLDNIPGDVNGDNVVDFNDLLAISQQWLWQGEAGAIFEDVNEDGIVNLNDYVALINQWIPSH